MNERIRELYKRSLVTDDYVNVGINGVELGIRFDTEKFAELIVRECAGLFDKDEIELALTERRIHNMILEHFGVEE